MKTNTTQKTEKPYWTCSGSVRGCCGKKHHSREAADSHISQDNRGCATQGGYSDRHITPGNVAAELEDAKEPLNNRQISKAYGVLEPMVESDTFASHIERAESLAGIRRCIQALKEAREV